MIQNPNVLVRNFFEKEGVVFNSATASSTEVSFTYEGNYQWLDLHYIKVANGGSLIIRDSSDNYGSNNPTGNIKVYNKDTGNELGTVIPINSTFPTNIRIDARMVKGVRFYISVGAAGKMSVSKVNGDIAAPTDVTKTVLTKAVDTIEKEGLVYSGEVSTERSNTYTGNFKYLDITFKANAIGGNFIIRDNENSSYNTSNLIKVIDKNTGIQYNNTAIPILTTGTLNLRVDASNVTGVRVYQTVGCNGRLTITKIFADENESDGIKFTSLIGSGNSGSKTLTGSINTGHKAFAVFKVSLSASVGDTVISIHNNTDQAYATKKAMCYSSEPKRYEGILCNFSGTKYFVADVSSFENVSVYCPSNITTKLTGLEVYYTDDFELAKRIAGIEKDAMFIDTIRNNAYVNKNYIGTLDNRRWYVLYVDFISGELTGGGSVAFDFRGAKIYRADMYATGVEGFNFNTGGLVSGYYFVDLSTATTTSNLANITTTNTQGLNANITYLGQYDDISQFVKTVKTVMPINAPDFELVNIGKIIHYALGDYWVTGGSTINLGKGDNIVNIVLSEFNWTIVSSVVSVKLVQPSRMNTIPHTNLMIHILNGDNDGADEWWVCDVTNIRDALTKSNWTKVKFWEKHGTKRKIPVKDSSLVDANHRYDTTLPDNFYNYNEVSSNGRHIAFQGLPSLNMLRNFAEHGKKMTVFGQYDTTGERINLWATTDGGYNFVSLYDFVGLSPNNDENIDTSAFSTYSSGLTLSKVVRNIPTAAIKEPEHKYTITELSGWSITKGVSTTITFSSAHGLTTGDIVAFTGNSTDEWNQLKTSELTSDSIGDNVYMVQVNSTTQVTLRPYRGSYDTQLQARHIHSVNETKSGFIIATGEKYPQGWTMFLQQKIKDAYDTVDVMTQDFAVYRLNSSENSLQRACGVIMIEDTADPIILFNSDDSEVDTGHQWAIEGRTNLPKSSANGLWKGRLSDIDSYENFECVCPVPEPAIWMIQYGGIILSYYMLGGISVSFDGGNTFKYYENFNGVNILNGIYKGKLIVNYSYALEFK